MAGDTEKRGLGRGGGRGGRPAAGAKSGGGRAEGRTRSLGHHVLRVQ